MYMFLKSGAKFNINFELCKLLLHFFPFFLNLGKIIVRFEQIMLNLHQIIKPNSI